MVEKMSGSGGSNSRASNALLIRAESIKKWKNSETAKEKAVRVAEQFTIQFDKGTVFLSAVASGDLDETVSLLEEGVDIDYRNNDGLTALHQACIDENEEMVNLLLERGANIEAVDNEGWTPLHAAASAGNVDIAQILVENNANLAAVNNEGEVPLDLAEEEEMEDFLSEEIDNQELEVEDARNEEEAMMLEDANSWLNKKKVDEVLDWQGATAMHVAASKGYNKVISTILQIGNIDVNIRDVDGWTPLHAAVHWGSKTACELLTEAGADFELKNSNGQTPCDLAEPEFVKAAEGCRKRSKELAKKSNFTKKRIEINIDMNDNSMFGKEFIAIELLKTEPPRPAVKGAREKFKNKKNNSEPVINNDTESESDSPEEPQSPPPVQQTPVSARNSTSEVDTSNKSSVTVNRLNNRDDKKDTKAEITTTFGRSGVGVGISRIKRDQPPEKEPEPAKPTNRFAIPSRPGGRLSSLDNKTEEKKPEETRSSLTSRYTSRISSARDEKDEDTTTNRFLRSKPKTDDDNRTRKKENDENESNEPETKRNTRVSDTTDTTESRRIRPSTEDDSNSRMVRTPASSLSNQGSANMSIAERLRKKNQELLASTSSDRALTDRTSVSDSYTNRSRDRDSTSSSSITSVRDRTSIRTSTSSSDTGDTKDLQRKLDQALKEVQDYKSKYDKIKKEKEDLEKQLEQYKEDIDKMQELKSDNIRLKDENGALIRVISKLSRTPASSS